MARRKAKPVLYKRKREGRTNYKKRLTTLLGGKPRLVARFTNTKVIGQIITFDVTGDSVLVGLDSSLLIKKGWNFSLKNHPAAYLTGFALAKAAAGKVDGKVVFDTGFRTPRKGGRVYSFLKGALDGGLNVMHGSEEIFATEERMHGKDIEEYAQKLETKSKEEYSAKFSASLKKGADPKQITKSFEKVKAAI